MSSGVTTDEVKGQVFQDGEPAFSDEIIESWIAIAEKQGIKGIDPTFFEGTEYHDLVLSYAVYLGHKALITAKQIAMPDMAYKEWKDQYSVTSALVTARQSKNTCGDEQKFDGIHTLYPLSKFDDGQGGVRGKW